MRRTTGSITDESRPEQFPWRSQNNDSVYRATLLLITRYGTWYGVRVDVYHARKYGTEPWTVAVGKASAAVAGYMAGAAAGHKARR